MLASQAKRNISLYYISAFFGELRFIMPIFVAYQIQFITLSQLSLLAGLRYAIVLVLELPTGAFGDLIGRKRSVILGQIFEALGLLMFAFFPSSMMIILGTVVRAIGESFTSGSELALVYDTLKETNRAEEFPKIRANHVVIVQIGLLLGAFFGGYLYTYWQGLPWLLLALSIFLNGLLWTQMTEPAVDTYIFTAKSYMRQVREGFTLLFSTPLTARLSIYYAIVGGLTWSWQVYFNLVYVANLGFSETTQGHLLALARFVNVFLIIKVLKIDRIITKKSGFWLFPGLMITAVVLAIAPSIQLNILAIIFLMLPSTLRYIILDKYTNDVFPSSHRATALSGLNMLVGFVYILYVSGTGFFLDTQPIQTILLIALAATIVIVIPLTVTLSKNFVKTTH